MPTSYRSLVQEMPEGEVHAWWAKPRLRMAHLDWLDEAERSRVAAYQREQDRARFVTGTAMVRQLYAKHLGVKPDEIPLSRDCPDCDRPHGKIRLATTGSNVQVSISHSGDWVVMAAHRGSPIGVDVERVDTDIDHLGVARVAFTEAERLHLAALDELERASAFTTYWSRKEAAVKAIGMGLRISLSDIEVSPPSEPARITAWATRPDLVNRLRLFDLNGHAGHRAAVAVLDAPAMRVVQRMYEFEDLCCS